jgi:hypothetical protein
MGSYRPSIQFRRSIYSVSPFSQLSLPTKETNKNRVIILFAFLIGINEGLCLGSVIDAGVSTIFVGLGEDPMYVLPFDLLLCPIRLPISSPL